MRHGFKIDRVDEVTGWKDAFLILAVKRCQPLLAEAGLPEGMAASPRHLMTAARHLLTDLEGLGRDGRDDVGYRRAAGLLLEDAFAKLARHYGEDEARALYDWAQRHFVDHAGHIRLWMWSLLLPRLAGLSGHGRPRTPSPLPAPALNRFVEDVRAQFGQSITDRDRELVAAARKMPLSPLEKRLVALEVTEPGDEPERDVLLWLEEAISQQRAYGTWFSLDSWLEPSWRQAILSWARNEGATFSPPVDADLIELVEP